MKLSIITINYNNAEGLRKTLASVASQTYADIEHIIVDGGSTDGSVEIIEAYASDVARKASGCVPQGGEGCYAAVEGQDSTPANGAQPLAAQDSTSPKATQPHKVTWISEPDKGIYNAMNKGIEIALGRRVVNDNHTSSPIANNQLLIALTDYIQILNSGDILAADDVTERMMAALKTHQCKVYGVKCKGTEDSNAENPASSPNSLIASSPIQNCPAILYGNMIKEYPDGRRVNDTCLGNRSKKNANTSIREVEWTMYDFIKGTINHDPTYIRRDMYEKYGLYDDTLKIVSDWKWFVQAVVFGGEKVYYIPMNVTIFDMTGISETNLVAREKERHDELEKMLPMAILCDYDTFHFPIGQYKRLKRHYLWFVVYFIERVLFKLEKWGVLRR